MCSRVEPGLQATPARAGRLVLVFALVCTAPLVSQSTAALQSRADSLLREWRQANVFAAVQDSLRAAQRIAGRDTIRVGSLTILANPSPLPLAQAAAQAWVEIERFYGPVAQELVRQPVIIQAVDPDTATLTSGPGGVLRIPWDQEQSQLVRALVGTADLGSLDRGLRDWLGGPVTPWLDLKPLLGRVYVRLVTTPSQAVHHCFAGDLSACRDALSLTDTADRITRWYGPEERRYLVATQLALFQSSGLLARQGRDAEFHSCAAGNDSGCLDLLMAFSPGATPPPLDYGARYTLLATAVALGGREAFSRLLASPEESIGRRLAEASLVTQDSLVARWRADVLAARPKPVSLPPWGPLIAIAWAGVFTGCALRSSRWRV
jgi:hypothetical protein